MNCFLQIESSVGSPSDNNNHDIPRPYSNLSSPSIPRRPSTSVMTPSPQIARPSEPKLSPNEDNTAQTQSREINMANLQHQGHTIQTEEHDENDNSIFLSVLKFP